MKYLFAGQQEGKSRSKGGSPMDPCHSHIYFSIHYHSFLHHFCYFFHSIALVYEGAMFSRGCPIFLQDPLKTYRMIL